MPSQNLVLSCLSGTSRDGLDVGLCRVLQKHTNSSVPLFSVELLETVTVKFPKNVSSLLSRICFSEKTSVPELMDADAVLGNYIGEQLLLFMRRHGIQAEDLLCIASHGQTLYHQAAGCGQHEKALTLQIAEPDRISRITGVPVAADFRQAHIAAGGEGAPLAPVLDYYAYRPEPSPAARTRVLINLGGIANLTLIPPREKLSEVIYGDTGPANIMLDQAVQRFAPDIAAGYDAGGRLAQQGLIHQKLFGRLISHPFFKQPLPKSTGPEVFNLDWVLSVADAAGIPSPELPLPDLLATLTELSAITLAQCIRQALSQTTEFEAFGSGGGMHNQTLIRRIGHHLGLNGALQGVEKLGGNADFKEVALFGLLGYFRQHRIRIPLFQGQPPVLLGKLSEA